MALCAGSVDAELVGLADELETSLVTSLAGVVVLCAELDGATLATGSDVAELNGSAAALEASLDTLLVGVVAL